MMAVLSPRMSREFNIMSGPNARWNEPVEISFPTTGSFKVAGPFEALAHLTDNWPAQQGLDLLKHEAPAVALLPVTAPLTKLGLRLRRQQRKRAGGLTTTATNRP